MFYRVWQVALVAGLSCVCGINYTWYRWFDYQILGINKGSLYISLQVWGYVLLALGVLLALSIPARKFTNVKMIDKQLEIVVAVVFVLQLPIVSLWFMALFMQGGEAVSGVLIHLILLGLALNSYLSSYPPSKQQDLPDTTEEAPHVS
ncbi:MULTISPECIES: hypothetical protein [Paenibacillus]|uniref:hypothetical protein n=1 Tax=Paenibacillus TaxID=44249 RepID=UPI002041F7EC|nr:hypothetical protein [Paenibacillus camelliae]